MNKLIAKSSALIALLTLFWVCAPVAKADNCDKVIDIMCEAFKKMTVQVDKVNSLDQLEGTDFSQALNGLDESDIPDSCIYKKLTSNDKKRLQKSYDAFVDAMTRKVYNLSGGLVTLSECETEMRPLKTAFKTCLDQSKDFYEFMNNMEQMF